jgi:uncharacterized RDD family membrane protein YckC
MTARTDDAIPSKPPAVARESYQGRYAGFASRFMSFVVDMIVITAAYLLLLAAIWFSAKILTGTSLNFSRGDIWVIIGYVIWAFIYFARSWGANGRTAGMALFGVQVVRADDGGDVSERKAALRTLVFPLSFLLLGLGFLGIVFGDRRRALHDVIAGTSVIYCWDARAARLRYLSRN